MLADWLAHFERLHPVGVDMGLARVSQVWQALRQQHGIDRLAKEKIITVAGTNGKGSACKMLSLLLSAQGYRVGMYTSPHIHHFRERVQINGVEADDNMLIRAFEAVDSARGDVSLSYFEATTLVGLLVFAWQKVDFAVLEVGLGGRLDAINIIDADAALITSIGLDHEAFLGNDLAQIALEKMGICRPNAPCVYAESGVYASVVQFARDRHIQLFANGRDYTLTETDNRVIFGEQEYRIADNIVALGKHQAANCAGALLLLANLNLLPKDYLSPLVHFSLPGRLQTIGENPDILLDVAHNQASAQALANYLHGQCHRYNNVYAVIGMLRDKDHRAVLQAFDGVFTRVFCGSTQGERGFSDDKLAHLAADVLNCPIVACGRLSNALDKAKTTARPNDLIIAFGSFLVAEELTSLL